MTGSAGVPVSQAAQPTGRQAGCDLAANHSGPTGACGGWKRREEAGALQPRPTPASAHSPALLFLFFTPLKIFWLICCCLLKNSHLPCEAWRPQSLGRKVKRNGPKRGESRGWGGEPGGGPLPTQGHTSAHFRLGASVQAWMRGCAEWGYTSAVLESKLVECASQAGARGILCHLAPSYVTAEETERGVEPVRV